MERHLVPANEGVLQVVADAKEEPAKKLARHAYLHCTDGNTQKLPDANIRMILIPKKVTHVWQPADQWIRVILRQKLDAAWDGCV